jgi:acetolactate synthase-1/3 small subunit
MEEQQHFTLSIFTENQIGLLHRITTVFTRRHMSITSLTTSESEVPGIYRFIIVLRTTETEARKLCKQLDKIIGVIKTFLLREEGIVQQELALYKVSTENLANGTIERVIRDNHARVLNIEPDYIMIEKTGHPGETLALFKELEPYGVMGFSRSGTIAISKKPLNLRSYLDLP